MTQPNWDQLIDHLVTEVTRNSDAEEGVVVCTAGPPPYRRLDCDHRALAYIRARPRKRMVRVDLSGLWRAAPECRLAQPVAAGATALIIRSIDDVPEVVRYLRDTIAGTRSVKRRASKVG